MNRERVTGRYLVERALGEGGMGAVYQVLDEATGKRLALKQLHGHMQARQAELFEREYQTLSSLRHPGIVQVFEYGVKDGSPYYTMELLEGRDLSKSAPMPWREVCACLRNAASILGVLHARRLVHRDVSPRNLWLTVDGQLKLLDFGALAPFGPTHEIVGTPAFVAPEVIAGKPLDARSDLFALGALGYWLLTSAHAFRATHVAELPGVWTKTPAAASSLAKLVKHADHTIPAELDRLIECLLRIDPDERPRTTADVVEHLNAIAGLRPEIEESVVRGYLENGAFVGRAREHRQFATRLAEAQRGKPQAWLVQGPEGCGRSRLLAEFATVARIAGATVVQAPRTALARPYATASALACELLKALPQVARAAAREHAPVLANLSGALSAALSTPPQPLGTRDALAERSRRQTALAQFFAKVAQSHALVVIVDDLQRVDDESQALLSVLARSPEGQRIMVLATVCSAGLQARPSALQGFRGAARVLELPELLAPETRELLCSVFGEIPYLERFAARIHQIAEGNPGATLRLAQHLVRSGAARYAEGAWALSPEVPDDLPATPQASLLAALQGLPEHARRLARSASLPDHGPFSRAMLIALAGDEPAAVDAASAALRAQGLLSESEAGWQLAQPALAEALRAELTSADITRGRKLLAELLAQEPDTFSQLRAAVHALHLGDFARGERWLLTLSRRIMAGEHVGLRAAAPLFAEALSLLERARRPLYTQMPVLSVLAVAGYQVDRAYAARYGEAALAALQQVLRFDLARRLRPYVGGLLALLAALLCATVVLRTRRTGLATLEIVAWLVAVPGYLMGPAALCMDAPRLRRYAQLFEPLRALGDDHAVTWVQRFCLGLAASTEDRSALARQLQRRVIARLRQPKPVRGLAEINRHNLLGAALYADGIRETLACDEQALVTADELEPFSALHAMQADHLRALYFSHRGDFTRSSVFERNVELKAIQLGTAWQAELLAPRHQTRIAAWTLDPATNKRAARALAALVPELPSFEPCERRARAADLVLRGKYAQALPLLSLTEVPLSHGDWTFLQALLARVHNALGQHEQAQQVCRYALAQLSVEDRTFVISNLPLEIELALAQAGSGKLRAAEQALDRLLTLHAHKGALVVGALERARASVALLAGDSATATQHCARMESCYRSTGVPSLFGVYVELRDALRKASGGTDDDLLTIGALAGNDQHMFTRVDLLLRSAGEGVSDRARTVLQMALDVTGADSGFVLLRAAERPELCLGNAPVLAAIAWARERLTAALDDEGHTSAVSHDAMLTDPNASSFDAVSHALTLLWTVDSQIQGPIAAVVLAAEAGQPGILPPVVVRALTACVVKA